MATKKDLDDALLAHMQWKVRLEGALAEGRSEFTPAVVKRDDACAFGKWLYGQHGDITSSDHYKKVKSLHAEFHRIAGTVLEHALSGNAAEAKKSMDTGGEYRSATGKLVLALNAWKDALP